MANICVYKLVSIMEVEFLESKRRRTPEADLQHCIVQALRMKGYFVYMNYQNITLSAFQRGAKVQNQFAMLTNLKKQGWVKGIPDLTVIGRTKEGKVIRCYIECKAHRGRTTTEQKEVHSMLRAIGEEVIIARELLDIEKLLLEDIVNIETLLATRV